MLIGKRNTGKSTLVTDILYHQRNNIPVAVIVCGTEDGCEHFRKHVPDVMIYNQYDNKIIQRVVNRQRKAMKQASILPPSQQAAFNPHCFVLLDDVVYDKSILRSREIRYIAMNGRHDKLTLAICSQYCMDIPTDIRSNIDYVFCLRENILSNREKLYKNFFGIFPDQAMFNEVLDRCTEDFSCLVLDNTSRSNKIEDCVFWYKAQMRDQFRFGHPKFWETAQKKLNPEYEADVDAFSDPKSGRSKKPSIPVKKLS